MTLPFNQRWFSGVHTTGAMMGPNAPFSLEKKQTRFHLSDI